MRFGNFEIEAPLSGLTLVVVNVDKPGAVGLIGTTLGDAGVNVGSIVLGKGAEGEALSLWNLEGDLPEEAMKKLQAADRVIRAALIRP